MQTHRVRADKMDTLTSIVLIAEPDQLDVLRQRPDFTEALSAEERRRALEGDL